MTYSDDEFAARLRTAVQAGAMHSGLEAERVLAASLRAQRRRTVGASAAAVAVVVAAVAIGPSWAGVGGRGEPVPAVPAVGHACRELPTPGLSDPETEVPPARWDSVPAIRGILHLVDERVPQYARVTSGPAACDTIPVAVLHDEPGQRGIVVYRDVAEPLLGATDVQGATVRGYPAHVVSPPAGHHFVSWTDDDDVTWFAEAAGLTVDELTATLTASLDDTGLATTPDGFASVAVPPHDPDGTVYRWSVQYEAGGYAYLEVTSPVRTPVETLGAWALDQEYTTVGDHRAVYLPEEQGGAGLRWATEDAGYRLVVAGADLPELRRIAEGLEAVAPDDPRLP